ncbi:MAG: histidine phosphatase family protein [Planctomycetota bacterium]|nr:histidine phosphatase family protein [Planctomycetota bacterium]
MIFYIIRHGESTYNSEGRIQGQTDIPLSSLGMQQAEAIAAALAKVPIEAIFCSPLQRAYQTATPLAQRLGLTLQTDDRLKEINAGIFQGLPWSEIEAKYPNEAVPWRNQVVDFVIPNGESRGGLMVRGLAAFEAIREKPYRTVAVVAHGGILSASFKALLKVPAETNPFSLYNGSISRLVWDQRIKLMTLNQVEHLCAAGLARDDETGNL